MYRRRKKGRGMIEQNGMTVKIVVTVKAAPMAPQFRVSEKRLEEETVSVVAECLSKEKSLEIERASLLCFDDCKWVFEGGMPLECGLQQLVRVFTDGSWSYPYDDAGDP